MHAPDRSATKKQKMRANKQQRADCRGNAGYKDRKCVCSRVKANADDETKKKKKKSKKTKKKKQRKRREHLGTWLIGILPYPSAPLPRNAVRFPTSSHAALAFSYTLKTRIYSVTESLSGIKHLRHS
jgi:hypothetical protein